MEQEHSNILPIIIEAISVSKADTQRKKWLDVPQIIEFTPCSDIISNEIVAIMHIMKRLHF